MSSSYQSDSQRAATVTVEPGQEKSIVIGETETNAPSARTMSSDAAASKLSSDTEPVAEVTIHMEPSSETTHTTQAQEVKEEAKETMKRGVKSGVKSLFGAAARGGFSLLAKSLQPKKESPKTPLSEEEMAKRQATTTTTETKETTTDTSGSTTTAAVKEKAKAVPKKLLNTFTSVASLATDKLASSHEVPPGEHSAPIEHTLASIAHSLHANSSTIGHGIARILRKAEALVEKNQAKREEIIEDLSIEKLLYEGEVQRRNPSELTSIQDINLAVHELTDLIAYKILRVRNKLVSKEEFVDLKESSAKLTGNDFIRQAEHSLKNRLLKYARKGAAKVSESVTESTGIDVMVPELTGAKVVEKLEVVPAPEALEQTTTTTTTKTSTEMLKQPAEMTGAESSKSTTSSQRIAAQ